MDNLKVISGLKVPIKAMVVEDFSNYKLPCLFLGIGGCDFKCDKDAGRVVCQNHALAESNPLLLDLDQMVLRYANNKITHAIVIGGLEPFSDPETLVNLIKGFRDNDIMDPIVLYTGHTLSEVTVGKKALFRKIIAFKNIIIKYGRYIPDRPSIKDPILGVTLASDNQFARVYGS